jgi:hypothetical protein
MSSGLGLAIQTYHDASTSVTTIYATTPIKTHKLGGRKGKINEGNEW